MKQQVIGYCVKCRGRGDIVRTKLVPRLKREFPTAIFEERCLSFCGPGAKTSFVTVNEVLVTATTDDELINKIHELL